MAVAGGIVGPGATGVSLIIAVAVAHRGVEVSVLAEAEVAGVVVAVGRGDVVDEDLLGRRIHGVPSHDEARDPVYGVVEVGRLPRRTDTKLVVRIVEVDLVVGREVWI